PRNGGIEPAGHRAASAARISIGDPGEMKRAPRPFNHLRIAVPQGPTGPPYRRAWRAIMTDINRRAPRPPPRSAPEILDEIGRAERRHNGPPGPSSDRWDGTSLDELAARRRWERTDREAVLRADLRRFENLRAEHLRWLRISVRQF